MIAQKQKPGCEHDSKRMCPTEEGPGTKRRKKRQQGGKRKAGEALFS